jgi:hypothetical protein
MEGVVSALILTNPGVHSATSGMSHSLPCKQTVRHVVNDYIRPEVNLFKQNTTDVEEYTSGKGGITESAV